MNMLYITNIMSHHQLPIARELAGIVGPENFRFAVMEPVYAERAKLGWESEGPTDPWILRAYPGSDDRRQFERWMDTADVVVCGTRRFDLLAPRIRAGKLTFLMGERWFRPPLGRKRLLHPRFALMAARLISLSRHDNFHYLTVGSYVPRDMAFLRAFREKTWHWAYFTEVPAEAPPERDNDAVHILWAGRVLGIKRVDTLVRAAIRLKQPGMRFELDLVGDGPMKKSIAQLAERGRLGSNIRFHASMKPEGVREIMRASDIFVLPSSGYEGWGAVVNEAMSEGCLTIASETAGASRVLIRDGENGLLFREGDDRGLSEILTKVIVDADLRRKLAAEGRRSMTTLWSPSAGAARLVELSRGMTGETRMPNYTEGPCSRSLPF